MDNLEIEIVDLSDIKKLESLTNFLRQFSLNLDQVDYSIFIKKDNEIIGTASKYNNLIKCVAVCSKFSGMNISTTLINEINNKIQMEGYDNSFLITKKENYSKFIDSGFYEVCSNDKITFLTSDIYHLDKYKNDLISAKNKYKNLNKVAAVVMNCNPLTNGHLYLIDIAAKENELVYIIPVLEDVSFFSYKERKEMIEKQISKYSNVKIIDGSEYLISKVTFPSYFLNEKDEVVKQQAKLDIGLFYEIYCKTLDIKTRYVGEEPKSRTTNIYNEIMLEILNKKGISVKIIPRLSNGKMVVSASIVREAILTKDKKIIESFTPIEEWDFLEKKEIYERALKNKNKISKKN